MFSCTAISISTTSYTFPITIKINKFHHRLRQSLAASSSSIHYDSLRVLEWDKLCDLVASFATTSLGCKAVKAQLWSLNQTYDESLRLLNETNAAVEMHKHGGCRLDFGHIDAALVESAIQHARINRPVNGFEALATATLIQHAETLQANLRAAIKEDIDWYSRFMPLTKVIMEFVINRSLVRLIEQVIDENGSVKDSASPTLKQSREQVLSLEKKIHRLMERLIRNERSEASILEVNNIDGRWCLRVDSGQRTSFKGLLLSSGSGGGSIVEPLSAIPLNDELQEARASMAKAEADVLFRLTEKIQLDLDDLEKMLNSMVQLDVINARATYGLSFVAMLEQDPQSPVPVDFFVPQKTRVLIVTGPNTGGKTICLKTVGLAAMMAKSGLYILASESAQIPWFDSVFADIGDEQSLSQSLSTFSGHLKQISNIKSYSTQQSLVLLDEVGAGTNPLEGAALGMALLESFAMDGSSLTMATTHHGELKTLKYSNEVFENACMEFDGVNLKPTYKILWGVPGRSNAINIAERLGLPSVVVDAARNLYGAASAEIDEVITDMEKFKQEYQELVDEAHNYLRQSRDLYDSLLDSKMKITEYSTNLRARKMQNVSEAAAVARSILHKRVRQLRASPRQVSKPSKDDKVPQSSVTNYQHTSTANKESATAVADGSAAVVKKVNQTLSEESRLPKVGDAVHVSSIGKKVTVLKVDSSTEEIVVQAGKMKLKLKLKDIQR
ncbi:LOW QUALITY PROTEIN: uncharacterized protein LOC129294528 [Prosopis cineraria]|uniref:LOW QUALITY PROTEIN: uncharacterized protein LOC129294528 n=1 Tax=Prosopis cineraria TaxID=364024 RepID=UPI002410B671|nr:LOW QUALITY PROTEIN: uncharacterized protein LOC129294528 [Prosopis cineraria]